VSRSEERQAEIRAMDAIERAMGKAEALPDKARERVLGWVRDTYFPEPPPDPWEFPPTDGGDTSVGDTVAKGGKAK
jgi:hypothetical protein